MRKRLVLIILAQALVFWSCQSPDVPSLTPPMAPTKVTASASNGKVVIQWMAVTGATSYKLYRSNDPGVQGTWLASLTSTAYTDATVVNGTTYYYQVTAVNADGESKVSDQKGAEPQPPVEGLTVTAGSAQVVLKWPAVADATRYRVYRSTTPGTPGIKIASPTSTEYTDLDVVNGTTYYYQVTSINGGGESPPSTQVSATPQVPVAATPTNLMATGSNALVVLKWKAVTGATSYNLYRSTTLDLPGPKIASATAAGYSDTSVVNCTTYYYQVTAVNAAGESAATAQQSVATGGVVTTLAGSDAFGSTNGTGAAASFAGAWGVAVDSSGTVYVADYNTCSIRKITPSGVVTTLAGSGNVGSTNGAGTAASFYCPSGVAVDSSGTVYVADSENNLIRKITPAGVVTTLAGSGSEGATNGTGTAASFNRPVAVAVDSSGTVYVADRENHLIRKITPEGVVTTLAGSKAQGSTNGTGTSASFSFPQGVAVDSSGTVYVADTSNNLIRKIAPSGVVTTLAGSGAPWFANGSGNLATFTYPTGVAVDSSGTVYVADLQNRLVREVSPSGVVTTLAGSGGAFSFDGIGPAASFPYPVGIAVDSTGTVYVGDYTRVRKIE